MGKPIANSYPGHDKSDEEVKVTYSKREQREIDKREIGHLLYWREHALEDLAFFRKEFARIEGHLAAKLDEFQKIERRLYELKADIYKK